MMFNQHCLALVDCHASVFGGIADVQQPKMIFQIPRKPLKRKALSDDPGECH